MMGQIFKYVCAVMVAAVLISPLTGHAQTMTEIRELSFGTFGVQNNDGNWQIIVTPDNDTFADPQIAMGQQGQRGEYVFTGLPPNVTFYLGVDVPNPPSEGGIVLDNPSPAQKGGSPVFDLSDLTIADGGVMVTDGAGEATLYIGGTLRTSGTGTNYDSGAYNGTFNLTIYY